MRVTDTVFLPATSVDSALANIGSSFFSIHKNLAPLHLEPVKNVVVLLNGSLQLWKKDGSQQFNNTSTAATAAQGREYKALKNLSHLAVALNITLSSIPSAKEGEVFSRVQGSLKALLHDLERCEKDESMVSHQSLFDLSKPILHRLLSCPMSLHKEASKICHSYNADCELILSKYRKDSAEIQIKSLHDIMNQWGQEHTIKPEETRVLIVVAHGPRDDLLERQYFEAWVEERNIYPVEMLPGQMANIHVEKDLILGFLAEQELNRSIGKSMLGDENAMFKDVLGPFAYSVLERLGLRKKAEKSGCPFSK